MSLQALYVSILASLNAVTDAEGYVSIKNDDQLLPCAVDGKRLAIPTRDLLRRGQWEEHGLQPFHPLSEHLNRGESAVIKKLRLLVQIRLSITYTELLMTLAQLCADKKKHKTVAPKAAAVLQTMPDADEKTVEVLSRILETVSEKSPGNLIKVFLRRGGMIDGRKVPRLCSIRFPLIDDFDEGDTSIHGVKLRKKDFSGIRALLEFVTPNSKEVETYGAGSVSDAAPYFDALMRGYSKVAERFNSLVHLYRKHLHNESELHIALDWIDDFEEMDKYRNDIPPLFGNEGDLLTEEAVGIQKGATVESVGKEHRTRLASLAAADQSPTRMTTEAKAESSRANDYNVDAAIRAIKTPTVPQIATPQKPQGGSGRSFSELMEERNRSMYSGQVPQQPMMSMMQPAAPGHYPGFRYGQPPAPMMMPQQPYYGGYGQPMPPMGFYPNSI